MMTDTAIEDVQKEVKILSALSGHANIVQFYDAYEDSCSVYIVMEYVLLVLHIIQNVYKMNPFRINNNAVL